MSVERSIYFFRPEGSDVEGAASLGLGGEGPAARWRGLLGGKGLSLHAMSARGFRVPPGFTIASTCCERFLELGGRWPEGLRAEIARALARLEEIAGRRFGDAARPLRVAVRSGAAESMPGMMDTVLGADSPAAVEDAVARVFRSWLSERAAAYRRERGIAGLRGTAATVQEMCPAETAGVAFTVDPASGEPAVIVEAVRGLGESLVSGAAQPERWRFERPGLAAAGRAAAASGAVLGEDEARAVAALALDLEERFGRPLDIEWAIAGGEVWLLQAREARRASRAALAEYLRAEAGKLRRFARAGSAKAGGASAGGDTEAFARHNLDETLSHASPLTWDILGEFFGGRGGFGALYRGLGYRPSARVLADGFLIPACGRVFAHLDRAAELYFGGGPCRHDAAAIRRDPERLDAPPRLEMKGASPLAALRAFAIAARAGRRTARARREHPARFTESILPRFRAWCREKERIDLEALDAAALLREIEERAAEVCGRFAPEALKLSLLAGLAHAELRDLLERRLGEAEGRRAAAELASCLAGDLPLEESRLLAAAGKAAREGGDAAAPAEFAEFLERFGHRGPGEMDLARPRWREDAAAARRLAAAAAASAESVEARRSEREQTVRREEDRVRARFAEAGGAPAVRELERRLAEARALLPWRERGKHWWMLGHDLIRRAAVALDRLLGLEGAAFQLTRAELRQVVEAGGRLAPGHRERIRARREEDRLARAVELPDSITPDDLERLAREDESGRGAERAQGEAPAAAAAVLRGAGIAPGAGAGRAWICRDPGEPRPESAAGGYVLVCSSTDPGWMPILAGARALVVERGGALSHGAIVCRDLGVPAVVVPGATALLRGGERLRVDGGSGAVVRLGEEGRGAEPAAIAAAAAPPGERPLPAEPWVPPARPRLGLRVALGLGAAVILSVLAVGVPALRSLSLAAAAPALDWTLRAGLSPFWAIASASALAALLAGAAQAAAGDLRLLRRMRERLRWYRRELKSAAGAAAETLARRRGQAQIERALELLRPIGWAFLPFCLALVWVEERFGAEPIRPGSVFTVTAAFRPSAGDRTLRFARLDAPPSLRLLDPPYRPLRPNAAGPELGPYAVVWSLEAIDEGPAAVAVTARDERLERDLLVTRERRFAPDAGPRRRGAAPESAIALLRIDYPPARVRLPGPCERALAAIAGRLAGRPIQPEQTAIDPLTAYLALAILLALILQRLAGLR